MAGSEKHVPVDMHLTARKVATTLPKHVKEISEEHMRDYQMMALLKNRDRITFNHGGLGFDWKVKYRNHRTKGSTGENSRSYGQLNQYKKAALDWRGYEATDSIGKREARQNVGQAALIKTIDELEKNIKDSLAQGLGPQFYNDGLDANNPEFWHGLQSLYRQAGQTLGPNNTPRNKDAGDKVIVPAGTYAGINCALGAYSGQQHDKTILWPEGTADTHYDFWSPLMLQREAFTGTGLGEKFKNALRFGITHAQRNSSKKGQMENIFTDRSNFIALKDHYEGKQTIETTAGTELHQLGFKNVLVFDGLEVTWEAACPYGFAYGLNLELIELMVIGDEFYEVDGPEYDMDEKIYKIGVETTSNLKFESVRNTLIVAPSSAVAA